MGTRAYPKHKVTTTLVDHFWNANLRRGNATRIMNECAAQDLDAKEAAKKLASNIENKRIRDKNISFVTGFAIFVPTMLGAFPMLGFLNIPILMGAAFHMMLAAQATKPRKVRTKARKVVAKHYSKRFN